MARSNLQECNKAMQREINAVAARRSRRKKRQMQEKMEKAYEENEKRIAHLERTVQELSSELRHTPLTEGSHVSRSLTAHKEAHKSGRPAWFGDPF